MSEVAVPSGAGGNHPFSSQDPDFVTHDPGRSRCKGLGFPLYFVACLAITSGFAGTGVGLWSSMGCGRECMRFLQERQSYAVYCAWAVSAICLVLYLLDFFLPPRDLAPAGPMSKLMGKVLVATACFFFLAACCFLAKTYPAIPLVLTTFSCPFSILGFRRLTRTDTRFVRERSPSDTEDAMFEERMLMLKLLTGEESDQRNFYAAAMYAFLLVGLLCAVIWVPWAVAYNATFEATLAETHGDYERELLFMRWSAPLIVSLSNLAFAGFAGMRVAMDRVYSATDEVKNRLVIGGRRVNQDLMDRRIKMLEVHLAAQEANPAGGLQATQDRMQQYLVQHISHMRQLSKLVKMTGCAFVALIGTLYVSFQLTVADDQIAIMIQGLMGALFLTFIGFSMVAFDRIWRTMQTWLMDLPLWKSAIALRERDFARGMAVCLVGPVVPLILMLSVVKHRVRSCRGLSTRKGYLTQRVYDAFVDASKWDKGRVLAWCYVAAIILVVYKMTPIVLYVFLAWMNAMMEHFHFAVILIATFLAGLMLFMLPPVPGPPIYLFGGIVISKKCPWGFWPGSLTCIVLSFVLKLTACAIQQKCIGEKLGSHMAILQAVGVHKPFMRAIQRVLQKPGLSFGKVMILCGGPDWPVSVIAGMLRISLVQCLLGTVPVIASIAPLALTGSFLMKRLETEDSDDSEVWLRAGNLMFTLTVLVSVGFWVGMGWAIQEEFDRHHRELTRPKEEFVDLEWLDHRAAAVARHSDSMATWSDVPGVVKVAYAGGAVGLTLSSHLMFWRTKLCFGTFKVTDDIKNLTLYGEGGLVHPPGAIALVVAVVSWSGTMLYKLWRRKRIRQHVAEAAQQVDATEAQWKSERRQQVAAAVVSPRSGAGGISELGSPMATPTASVPDVTSTPLGGSSEDVFCSEVKEVPAEKHSNVSDDEGAPVQTLAIIPRFPDSDDVEFQDPLQSNSFKCGIRDPPSPSGCICGTGPLECRISACTMAFCAPVAPS
mmetsp:Transcript_18934/g.52138  ORF Transcript_18934/g.52138 Transcript_18934/m.52138 type:complete len:995 (-) Transcript_18934:229-3213(-)